MNIGKILIKKNYEVDYASKNKRSSIAPIYGQRNIEMDHYE